MMSLIEQLASAALERDALKVRSLTQELLRSKTSLTDLDRPTNAHPNVLAVAAGLLELLASRKHLVAPSWTAEVGAMDRPFFLLDAADRMPRLRAWCEAEAPEPLRRRGLFAPPDFLDDA